MAARKLLGSTRAPLPGAVSRGKADPAERLEVTLILRRASALPPITGKPEAEIMSRADFASSFGASVDDVASVKTFAAQHNLTTVQEAPARRTVVLSGTVADFQVAFGVELQSFDYPGGSYRGRVGDIFLPEELDGVVEAVLGLDNRPQAKPHFRMRSRAIAAAASFTPVQLASLYDFPDSLGQGQCIAIIELGGGYRPADLQAYFSGLNVSVPSVTTISVDHATNSPTGNPDGPDGEVMLDIEVAGAIASKAALAVYFAPNTDAGFLNAITTAVHDETNKPNVISISWGGPESAWTGQAMQAMDAAFQSAAALGVTVCIATGDNGSTDGVPGSANHADFPASSPHALACGGTSLRAAGGTIADETVWNDGAAGGATGGGVSTFFQLPAWQTGLNITAVNGSATSLENRGIPDVAGDADPNTGYNVRVDGSDTVIGGTSAVAPLWAALIARINGAPGRGQPVGFVNAALYAPANACNDIIEGNNGGFSATPGWDACTGLGSPNGSNVAAKL
jgi:kumamolisin